MKAQHTLILAAALISPAPWLSAQEIVAEFGDLDQFTDFSVYGMSEEKTLSIYKSEFDSEIKPLADKYFKEGESLVMQFTDIDMAGDIQPWRNRYSADIRYIEDVYPPRVKFTYTVKDAEGNVLKEGEASLSDLAYRMNTLAPMRTQYENFFYENTLIRDWLRKTFRDWKDQ